MRYRRGKDNIDYDYTCRVMDKVIENVNMWVKKILLASDESSWQHHSPNVVAAKQCHAHERMYFVRSSLVHVDENSHTKHGITVLSNQSGK